MSTSKIPTSYVPYTSCKSKLKIWGTHALLLVTWGGCEKILSFSLYYLADCHLQLRSFLRKSYMSGRRSKAISFNIGSHTSLNTQTLQCLVKDCCLEFVTSTFLLQVCLKSLPSFCIKLMKTLRNQSISIQKYTTEASKKRGMASYNPLKMKTHAISNDLE